MILLWKPSHEKHEKCGRLGRIEMFLLSQISWAEKRKSKLWPFLLHDDVLPQVSGFFLKLGWLPQLQWGVMLIITQRRAFPFPLSIIWKVRTPQGSFSLSLTRIAANPVNAALYSSNLLFRHQVSCCHCCLNTGTFSGDSCHFFTLYVFLSGAPVKYIKKIIIIIVSEIRTKEPWQLH